MPLTLTDVGRPGAILKISLPAGAVLVSVTMAEQFPPTTVAHVAAFGLKATYGGGAATNADADAAEMMLKKMYFIYASVNV